MTANLTFIAPTKRRKMTQARRAKIFLARNGECFVCHRQIRQGERWIIEHPEPLSMGGSDSDADLWPAHEKCGIAKTSGEAPAKSKRDRLVTKGFAGKPKSRGLRKPPGTVHVWGRGYVKISQDMDAEAQREIEG